MARKTAAERFKEMQEAAKKVLHLSQESVQNSPASASPNPVSTSETLSQEPAPMTKPQSYFSVQEHEFQVSTRDGSGEKKSVTDWALYISGDIFAISYKAGRNGSVDGTKYLRLKQMKELASILDEGYPEDRSFWKIEDSYKELAKELKGNKILALDFLKWLSDEVSKIQPVTSSATSSAGTRTTSAAVLLASIVNKYFDHFTADGEPDISARVEALRALVTDSNLIEAEKWLLSKLSLNGWNREQTITNSKTKKVTKNPAYGQVWMQSKSSK